MRIHSAPDGDVDGVAEVVPLHVVDGEGVGVEELVRVREGVAVTGARWRRKWALMKATECPKAAKKMPTNNSTFLLHHQTWQYLTWHFFKTQTFDKYI